MLRQESSPRGHRLTQIPELTQCLLVSDPSLPSGSAETMAVGGQGQAIAEAPALSSQDMLQRDPNFLATLFWQKIILVIVGLRYLFLGDPGTDTGRSSEGGVADMDHGCVWKSQIFGVSCSNLRPGLKPMVKSNILQACLQSLYVLPCWRYSDGAPGRKRSARWLPSAHTAAHGHGQRPLGLPLPQAVGLPHGASPPSPCSLAGTPLSARSWRRPAPPHARWGSEHTYHPRYRCQVRAAPGALPALLHGDQEGAPRNEGAAPAPFLVGLQVQFCRNRAEQEEPSRPRACAVPEVPAGPPPAPPELHLLERECGRDVLPPADHIRDPASSVPRAQKSEQLGVSRAREAGSRQAPALATPQGQCRALFSSSGLQILARGTVLPSPEGPIRQGSARGSRSSLHGPPIPRPISFLL
nr:ESX-1 secretion-associated protein EspI-like [Manis javanica]